jgi:membrane protein
VLVALQRFPAIVLQHFFHDRCLQGAGALSYTTILSLVPLTAVMVGVLSAFPVFDVVTEQLQGFIFKNFVPAAGEVVQQHLLSFADNTRGLTTFGIIFLMVTAVMMVSAINSTMNGIWRVHRPRPIAVRLMVFWSLLTLGPLLIGFSLAVTSYLVSLPLFSDAHLAGVRRTVLRITPWATTTAALAIMYTIVPDQRVRVRDALAGAAVGALLFEFAKKGFALYVTSFPAYQTIYGTLATIPIFLIWVYVSWVVVLLGAEFTFCLGHYRQLVKGDQGAWPGLLQACQVLGVLFRRQDSGQGATTMELMNECPEIMPGTLMTILEMLATAHLVHRTERGIWLLTRDLGRFHLGDLYSSGSYLLPRPGTDSAKELSSSFPELADGMRSSLEDLMRIPIAEIIESRTASQRPVAAAVDEGVVK